MDEDASRETGAVTEPVSEGPAGTGDTGAWEAQAEEFGSPGVGRMSASEGLPASATPSTSEAGPLSSDVAAAGGPANPPYALADALTICRPGM